jgi:proteasome lid subunit RPN8/RPN11
MRWKLSCEQQEYRVLSLDQWLSPELVDQIRLIAGVEDTEVCGIITPDSQVVRMPNISPNPQNSYQIGTGDLVNALCQYCTRTESELSEIKVENVIIWHTHPGGLVGPSRGDMRSKVNGFKYLVLTLPGGEAVQF